jgi:hypothetical protein
MARNTLDEQHVEFTKILEDLLSEDQNITAREIARRHTTLKSASTITRHPKRRELMLAYQAQQSELRLWKGRLSKTSKEGAASKLASQQSRIDELEKLLDTLTTGHISLIAAVAQVGGMGKLLKFYENFRDIRNRLYDAGAIPAEGKVPIVRIGKTSR